VFSVREPSSARLDAVLNEQSGQPFSYPDPGASRSDLPTPKGYRHARQAVELGYGTAVFDRASQGLRSWQAHRTSGTTVHPPDAGLDEGLAVVLAVPVAFLWMTVACRIVYVAEEPNRFEFAYGTLPHHVIRGEETFAVERDESGVVRFVVSAFLRPRRRALRPAGPVVYRLDQRLVRRYLHGLRRYVAEHP
jgi:uncharacterized protein (UPF0548 family)